MGDRIGIFGPGFRFIGHPDRFRGTESHVTPAVSRRMPLILSYVICMAYLKVRFWHDYFTYRPTLYCRCECRCKTLKESLLISTPVTSKPVVHGPARLSQRSYFLSREVP